MKNLFTIQAEYLEDEKVYADMEKFGSFESQDDAILKAKHYAEEVGKREEKPILVHVLAGVKVKPSGLLYGKTTKVFTISTKPADETEKALKNAGYRNMLLNGFTGSDGDVVVMTVIILDSEGNINHDTARYDSVEEAITEGNAKAAKWMGDYRCPWELCSDGDGKVPCIVERYGETMLEMRECDSIAEFDYHIYKLYPR